MRFAALATPKTEPRSPAAEFVRKLLGADKAKADTPQQPLTPAEAVPDLDQRVRLVGEW